MKKVFAKGKTTNVRQLPNVESKVIATVTDKAGLNYKNMTPKHNGRRWFIVDVNGVDGYIREDVGELVEPKVQGKKLQYLIIHCTATPEGRKVTKEDIIRWHTSPKSKGGRGWSVVGYSRMVDLDGNLIKMHDYNENDIVEPWEVTNGASGVNSVSRHIVYVGGTDNKGKAEDTRTSAQKETLKQYVLDMVKRYPNIKVAGHYHFANKACPSFNVEEWCKEIGVAQKNIQNGKV